MRDILFEKKVVYKSIMKPAGIEEVLQSLIKIKDKPDNFTGKVNANSFVLTPVLGTRQNFKITMFGEVKSESSQTIVEIKYLASPFLKIIIYLIFFLFLFMALAFRFFDFNFSFQGVSHVEYILLGASAILLFKL